MRSLEEIAYTTFPEAEDRARRCLAALREAADAARQEEREVLRKMVEEFAITMIRRTGSPDEQSGIKSLAGELIHGLVARSKEGK